MRQRLGVCWLCGQVTPGGATVSCSGFTIKVASHLSCLPIVMFSRSGWLPDYGCGDMVLELAAEAQASVFGKEPLDCKRGSNSTVW